jgi:tetratricopeptide (TPR) repeat protein
MLSKHALPVFALLALTPVAYAVPDDGAAVRARPVPAPTAQKPDPAKARKDFNVGFEEYQMATGLENANVGRTGEDALHAKDAVKVGITRARDKFRAAVAADPDMKEGWNMLGYTSRKLGNYEESLSAYDKALALNPDYPEAIEYRAELFLLTGRLADVKEAYASLLKSSPSYAAVLKTSAKDWVKAKTPAPAVTDAQRAEFSAWVAKL